MVLGPWGLAVEARDGAHWDRQAPGHFIHRFVYVPFPKLPPVWLSPCSVAVCTSHVLSKASDLLGPKRSRLTGQWLMRPDPDTTAQCPGARSALFLISVAQPAWPVMMVSYIQRPQE